MSDIIKHYHDHSQSNDIEIKTPMTIEQILELREQMLRKRGAVEADMQPVPTPAVSAPHMPSYITHDEGLQIFRFLIDNQFIEPSTKVQGFLYLMGCTDMQPDRLEPIGWKKTSQVLRVFIRGIYRKALDSHLTTHKELKQFVPQCFVNHQDFYLGNKKKYGQPMTLCSSKQETSNDMDLLNGFLKIHY